MTAPELVPLDLDSEFKFGCHCQVPCFNHCCRDLNQALTPYDVLRLKQGLGVGTEEFFSHYAEIYPGQATGLPVACLRFSADKQKRCPFVAPEGCRVYDHRPSSCRLYPLARALQRSRIDGSVKEYYAMLHETHCSGFKQEHRQTVRQWISGQELAEYLEKNDALMELIALKNQMRPGALSAEHQRLVQMAFYDLKNLKRLALAGTLPGMDQASLTPLPDEKDDPAWLLWGFAWLRRLLFGQTRR